MDYHLKSFVESICLNNDIHSENANKDSNLIPTKRDLISGELCRQYAREYMLPERVKTAHDDGFIHFHDMDYSPVMPSFNCFLVDLKNMLEGGFKIGNAQIETPKSIETACAITSQIVANVSSHTYGKL